MKFTFNSTGKEASLTFTGNQGEISEFMDFALKHISAESGEWRLKGREVFLEVHKAVSLIRNNNSMKDTPRGFNCE